MLLPRCARAVMVTKMAASPDLQAILATYVWPTNGRGPTLLQELQLRLQVPPFASQIHRQLAGKSVRGILGIKGGGVVYIANSTVAEC
jgi:hypothetical protein